VETAGRKGFRQPWPVISATAFHFGVFGDQFADAA
jgi:hypothetical protein